MQGGRRLVCKILGRWYRENVDPSTIGSQTIFDMIG
jgi:hypothetical protein